jgi:hypothetical protein
MKTNNQPTKRKKKEYITLKLPKIPKKNIKIAYAITCFVGLFLMIWVLLKIGLFIGLSLLNWVTSVMLLYLLLDTTAKFFAGIIVIYVLWKIMVSLVMAAFQITEAFMKELKKIRSRK